MVFLNFFLDAYHDFCFIIQRLKAFLDFFSMVVYLYQANFIKKPQVIVQYNSVYVRCALIFQSFVRHHRLVLNHLVVYLDFDVLHVQLFLPVTPLPSPDSSI